MTEVPNNYAEIVRAKRLGRGWTQGELAERLGMTNVTVSRWEKARVVPTPVFWERFLEVIGEKNESLNRSRKPSQPQAVDFLGDGLAVRAMVEGIRIANPG